MTDINKIPIKIKKLISSAKVPVYKTVGSAGFDFYAVIDREGRSTIIYPHETKQIDTGLAMEIPLGYEVEIRPRSGLSLTTKLRIPNSPGTIDSDFRGQIQIILENIGDKPIVINHHDRIAQGVLKQVPQADFIVVDELSDTIRGSGGFGHSGIK